MDNKNQYIRITSYKDLLKVLASLPEKQLNQKIKTLNISTTSNEAKEIEGIEFNVGENEDLRNTKKGDILLINF